VTEVPLQSCQEIISKRLIYIGPYRKPTQVDEESILRCSS